MIGIVRKRKTKFRISILQHGHWTIPGPTDDCSRRATKYAPIEYASDNKFTHIKCCLLRHINAIAAILAPASLSSIYCDCSLTPSSSIIYDKQFITVHIIMLQWPDNRMIFCAQRTYNFVDFDILNRPSFQRFPDHLVRWLWANPLAFGQIV